MEILAAAPSLNDLRTLPSNRLEALEADRAGQFSIRINMQWRLCFEWPDGAPGPSNVEIVDYH
ncbi:MAG: type II toxin-antitoxin system RelE/ParE family toxin [Aliidongia sp.]